MIATCIVPADHTTVDFISDLHLHASDPATFDAWRDYLLHTPAQSVFILGDLFEVWVGDDVLDAPGLGGFESVAAQVLREASARRRIHFLAGNRDFLVGPEFFRATGVHALPDACAAHLPDGQCCLLLHGDAQCLDDHDYMAWRAQVRTPEWRRGFLALPLSQRAETTRAMRQQSQARQTPGRVYADVDTATALALMDEAEAQVLVHGHTHRPGHDRWDATHERWVLSDWDLLAPTPRGDVLRWSPGQWQRVALPAR